MQSCIGVTNSLCNGCNNEGAEDTIEIAESIKEAHEEDEENMLQISSSYNFNQVM